MHMAEAEMMEIDRLAVEVRTNQEEQAGGEEQQEEVRFGNGASQRSSGLSTNLAMISTALLTISVVFFGVEKMLAFGTGASKKQDDRRRRTAANQCALVLRPAVFFQVLNLQAELGQVIPRKIECGWYIKPRSIQWFVFFIDYTPTLDPQRFTEFFGISPNMFYYIVDLVRDDLITDPPVSLRILPNRHLQPERQVALALRRLSTGDGFLGLSKLFGLSKTTAIKSYWRFVKAFNAKAEPLYLAWPEGEQMQRVKQGFWSRWGFPNCVGAIDGTHIPIELPAREDPHDYFDYKHNKSISVQAIVDVNLRFLDVFAGWPGSVQDTRLLRKSNFYRSVVYLKDRLNGPTHRTRSGHVLREYLLGDGGYPCLDWLIVPYPRGVSPMKDEWNERHSQCRMAVERAFGRLKGTWRILSRILWKPSILGISPTVLSCAILHNMIIDRGEHLSSSIYSEHSAHPRGYSTVIRPTRAYLDGGLEARNALCDDIMHHRGP